MKKIKTFKIYHNRYKRIFDVHKLLFDDKGQVSGGSFFMGKESIPFNIKEVDVLHVF